MCKTIVAGAAILISMAAFAGEYPWPVGTKYVAPNATGRGTSWDDPMSLPDAINAIQTWTQGAYVALDEGVYDFSSRQPMKNDNLFDLNNKGLIRIGSRYSNPTNTIIIGPGVAAEQPCRCFGNMYGNCEIFGLTISNFTAKTVASAVNGAYGTVVRDCIFSGNKVLEAPSDKTMNDGNYGCVVFGCEYIRDCVFDGNDSAVCSAVGIRHTDGRKLEVSGCVFNNCTGGFAITGWKVPTAAVVSNCTFTGRSGGCIRSGQSCPIQVYDCTFEQCESSGPLVLGYAAEIALNRCAFVANTNVTSGVSPLIGTLTDAWAPDVASVKMTNCLVAKNVVKGNQVVQGVRTLVNCTIADNVCATTALSGSTIKQNANNTYLGSVLVNCLFSGNVPTDLDFKAGYSWYAKDTVFATNCVYTSALHEDKMEQPCEVKWLEKIKFNPTEDRAHPWGYALLPAAKQPNLVDCGNTAAAGWTADDIDLAGKPRLYRDMDGKLTPVDIGCYEFCTMRLPEFFIFVR